MPFYVLRIPEVVTAIEQESPEEIDSGALDNDASKRTSISIASLTKGGFDILQPLLVSLRVPFDLWTEACFDNAENTMHYRLGKRKKQGYTYTQIMANGEPVIPIAEISRVMKRRKDIKAVNAILRRYTIPPLRDLASPPARLKKRLVLPVDTVLKQFRVNF
jgi:hypothetical protein